MEAHIEAMVKSLVAVAWADGHLAAEEEEVLEALLAAFHVTGEDAERMRVYGREPRTLSDVPLADLSADDRRLLLQQAVIVTYCDGKQSADERSLLTELATTLRIPAPEATSIIEAADRRAERLVPLL